MTAADVAIARCRREVGSEPTDLYPDADAQPLATALLELGLSSASVAWDDPHADWASFGWVVASSTWDSVDRPNEFLAWASAVSDVSVLCNPLPVLEWGIDKCYLRELSDSGIPVIETTWIEPVDPWRPPEVEFVVKPTVSAGGRNTARYLGGDPRSIEHVRQLQATGQSVMIQPYLSSVDEVGELDLVFIAGAFSHAVHKESLLRSGEGIVEQLWTRLSWSGTAAPDREQLSIADEVMASLTLRFDQVPAYARIDLVADASGSPVVIEVEVIDPYLSLDVVPEAAHRLARAIVR